LDEATEATLSPAIRLHRRLAVREVVSAVLVNADLVQQTALKLECLFLFDPLHVNLDVGRLFIALGLLLRSHLALSLQSEVLWRQAEVSATERSHFVRARSLGHRRVVVAAGRLDS